MPACQPNLVDKGGKCTHPDCGRDGEKPCVVTQRIPSCDKGLIELPGVCGVKGACGADGQRACQVIERVPSCNANLVEKAGKCERLTCGAEGQRACVVTERIPSCDKGLVEKSGKCSHPDCGRMGERACTLVERVPSCDSGLIEIAGCIGECHGAAGMCMNPNLPLTEPTANWSAVPAKAGADPLRGWADVHVHMFSNLAFGGAVLAGAAWDRTNGVKGALSPDFGTDLDVVSLAGTNLPVRVCPANIPNCGRNLLHGDHVVVPVIDLGFDDSMGARTHDGARSNFGAPLFNGWPTWHTTSHQQVYYKWLERAWRGGMRLMTMLAVNNEVACGASKHVRGSECGKSMPGIDAQLDEAHAFESWHASQPGGGWFVSVKTPEQAEATIRAGKLAVVLGIEVDTLFGCKQKNTCTDAFVASEVDRYFAKDVRHIYPTHDFDGAFAGTAIFMADLNSGNLLIEGSYIEPEPCRSDVVNDLALFPKPAGCNKKGLTPLGVGLIRKLMDKGMLIDVDHMSAKAIDETAALAKEHGNYPLMAGHGLFADMYKKGKNRHERMRTNAQLETLRQLGGLVSVMTQDDPKGPDETACLHSSTSFKLNYEFAVSKLGGRSGAAVPFGSDFNGMASHVGPRYGDEACGGKADQKRAQAPRPRLAYPFVIAGFGKFDNQITGQRTFDFNTDGLAHIGLFPDLIADLELQGTDIEPLMRSAAGYANAWRKGRETNAAAKGKGR